jgi:ribosomal-protein-alanine acetyltransferase
MTVREATAADLDALCAIESACFPDDPWSRGMLAEELARPGGIVLVAEGTSPLGLAGFAMGWAVLDELHVLQVAVRPDVRRAGLGRALVTALHARAPYADVAWLEVRHDNLAAIRLYERMDYAAVARRPRYYSDGSDCVVMRAALRRAQ